jgi:hypothetical protein
MDIRTINAAMIHLTGRLYKPTGRIFSSSKNLNRVSRPGIDLHGAILKAFKI